MSGAEVSLVGNNLPDRVTIVHFTGENNNVIAKEENECDVTIIIGETRLKARKNLLCERIPFFYDLFNSNMSECSKGEIQLSNEFCEFDLSTLQSLLDYVHTGRITISTSTVQDLMLGASFFRIESVMKECAMFIKRRMNIENILAMYHFCNAINYREILSDILNFIDKNYIPLSQTVEFLELLIDDIVLIHERSSLNIDNETQVFDASTRWIAHKPERCQHSSKLLKTVRFEFLPIESISSIEESEWIVDNSACVDFMIEAKKRANERIETCEPWPCDTTDRFCDDSPQLFIAFAPEESRECPQLYNPITNKWTNCTNANMPYKSLDTMQVSDGKIFFSYDKDGTYQVREIYDTQNNTSHNEQEYIESMKPSMVGYQKWLGYSLTSRASILQWMSGKLYGTGGRLADGLVLSTLEIYDAKSDEWKALASMRYARFHHSSASLNGKIYVFGGCGRLALDEPALDSVECFDPSTDSWTSMCSMNSKRMAFRIVILHNQVYVIGGLEANSNRVLNSMEKYDPLTDKWITLKNMKTKRAFHEAKVSCGQIFVFGGYDSWRHPYNIVKTVEMYDPVTDTWEDREPIPTDSDDKSCCILQLGIPKNYSSPAVNLEAIYISGFSQLSLKEELRNAIIESGFMHPTEAQFKCIPEAIRGLDVLCQGDSKKGKSTAFIISTLQLLIPTDGVASVLVLCSSRVDTEQMKIEFERFSKYLPTIKIGSFTGITEKENRKKILEQNCPNIVIGTPVHIHKLVKCGSLKIDKINRIILDDCATLIDKRDRRKFVKKVLDSTNKKKQILISTSRRITTFCDNLLRKEPLSFQYICE